MKVVCGKLVYAAFTP
ncbi:hypothetical protein QX226_22325 [Vibrio vulnificus]|nr:MULTISPECIES: hypothetical protein [Vibrio]MDV2384020.1 hypothetical protein [Vibrio cholerae]MCG6312769.1 hypothetical protein [Vibrio vulnificus]MCU8102791.1 hypothetical protein [Vibrio vulnificus]MCU8133366.1 hypothetical protein [Vibrio vulnificus]MCU8135005.1 hypothetical protein [Vibrio vulnificus]